MESNHRHKDFQSSALPTELQSHIWRFRRGLNPRSSAWQADVLTTALRNHGCGRGTRTHDLRVMSPTSYQLLHPAIYQLKMAEEVGFEPTRRSHDLPVFKTGPFNQLGYSSICFLQYRLYTFFVFIVNIILNNKKWCLRPDLNRHELWHSQDFKSCASTNSATWAGTVLNT